MIRRRDVVGEWFSAGILLVVALFAGWQSRRQVAATHAELDRCERQLDQIESARGDSLRTADPERPSAARGAR